MRAERETLRPDTKAQVELEKVEKEITYWLEKHGDAQAEVERLQGELEEARSLGVRNRELTSALAEARAQIADLQAELNEVRSVVEKPTVNLVTPVAEKPDLEELAVAALASLKLGKQAPGYRAAVKAIAKFRELLR